MPPQHPARHPSDDMMAEYAGGDLAEAPALLVATHLALCPGCRRLVADLEALGGELLSELPVQELAAGSLERTLARLDVPTPAPGAVAPSHQGPGVSPLLPRPLRDYMAQAVAQKRPWRSVMPGLRTLRLKAGETKTWVMELAPGRPIPEHGHRGQEIVLVLSGGYHDGEAGYGPGDVQISGPDLVHEPVADAEGPCLCLVVVEGGIRPASLLGRLAASLFGY